MPRNRSANEIVNGANRSEVIFTGSGKDIPSTPSRMRARMRKPWAVFWGH